MAVGRNGGLETRRHFLLLASLAYKRGSVQNGAETRLHPELTDDTAEPEFRSNKSGANFSFCATQNLNRSLIFTVQQLVRAVLFQLLYVFFLNSIKKRQSKLP